MISATSQKYAWGLLAASLVAGASLNFVLPLRDIDHWFRFFMFGAPVRLAAFGFLYWLDRNSSCPTRLDFSGPIIPAAVSAGAMLALWFVFLTQASGEAWSPAARVAGLAGCLAVGLWEEYLFRGVLLDWLLKRHPPTRAVWLDSLLFMATHTRLQAFPAWPHIFLTGVVSANLRVRGMSLGYLVLMHAAVDYAFFLHGKQQPPTEGMTYWLFLTGLFVYAIVSLPHKITKKDPDMEEPSCRSSQS